MQEQEMNDIYTKIEKIIKTQSKEQGLVLKKAVLDSVAKDPKRQLHAYGSKKVQIGKRKPVQTYVVGCMLNKKTVGFYSMAVYAFPKEFDLSPEMKKPLKGKSCFQIKELDKKMEKELEKIVAKSISLFKKEGWV